MNPFHYSLPFFVLYPTSSGLLQGKIAEGLVHLERIANLKEPDEPRSKAHYFDGLLLLARYMSFSI